MTDGPGSVRTLILVVTEEDRSELLFPESELGIEGVPKGVGDNGEGDGKKDVDNVESEGTANACAASKRATVEVHMNA
jgi:hypothetical protein